MEYLKLTWADVDNACGEISESLYDSGLEDAVLVGIARGGLVPLRMISDRMPDVDFSTLQVKFYSDIGVTRDTPEVVCPVQCDVGGRTVVLVDDISDTGESLRVSKEHVFSAGAQEVLTATVAMKPKTSFVPDICSIETPHWVIFPWEINETMNLLIERAGSLAEAVKELESAGFKKSLYEKILKLRFRD